MSKPAIFGIVKNDTQAQLAVDKLAAAGFVASDISVLSGSTTGVISEDVSLDPTLATTPATGAKTREVGHTNSTKAPEGATTGGVSGGVLGGVAGWLVGIGALAIPGVGPFVAAGPILAALSGAAIGATAGGLVGGLVGFGIPEYEAELYAGHLKQGNILIGVHAETSEESDAAQKALKNAGATDIKSTSEVVAK